MDKTNRDITQHSVRSSREFLSFLEFWDLFVFRVVSLHFLFVKSVHRKATKKKYRTAGDEPFAF